MPCETDALGGRPIQNGSRDERDGGEAFAFARKDHAPGRREGAADASTKMMGPRGRSVPSRRNGLKTLTGSGEQSIVR
jgi:hypothetical protein